MEQEKLKALLQALAEGSISEQDYELLMNYLHQEGTDTPLLQAMEIPPVLPSPKGNTSADALFNRIKAHPDFKQAPLEQRGTVVRRTRLFTLIGAAASLLLAVAVTVLLVYKSRTAQQPAAQAWTILHTAPGERRQVSLPDGSTVWLNAQSILKYEPGFAGRKREVYLEGEAFFTVQKNEQLPFIVHTRQLHTQVLGTSFDIQAYDSTRLTVTVTEGKVSVGSNMHPLGILTQNQQLQYNQSTAAVQLNKVDGETLTAWRNGRLLLNNTSMEEAAVLISRWYGVQVNIKDPFDQNDRFSVAFEKGENLRQVMTIIGAIAHCSYSMNDTSITITR